MFDGLGEPKDSLFSIFIVADSSSLFLFLLGSFVIFSSVFLRGVFLFVGLSFLPPPAAHLFGVSLRVEPFFIYHRPHLFPTLARFVSLPSPYAGFDVRALVFLSSPSPPQNGLALYPITSWSSGS